MGLEELTPRLASWCVPEGADGVPSPCTHSPESQRQQNLIILSSHNMSQAAVSKDVLALVQYGAVNSHNSPMT